jgi:hypothetical protein
MPRLAYSPVRPPWFRRRRVRKWLLIVGVVAITLPAIPLSVGWYYLRRASAELADLDARFARVQRGMSRAEVQAIMGTSGTGSPGAAFPAWEDEPLTQAEAARIAGVAQYPAPSSVFPSMFEITFDRDAKVVGKHRYD